jgi:glutathione peroxidase
MNSSIHQFLATDIKGDTFEFSNLKGKKVMIVNTASQCGLTPQYEKLQELYDTYKDSNFTIIGFPSNDFMGQEPGSNSEISKFCVENYGVEFKMMGKIKIKGDDKHDVYQFLTDKEWNNKQDSSVEWNFQKYLLNKNGELEKVISPQTSPMDEEIVNWIKQD